MVVAAHASDVAAQKYTLDHQPIVDWAGSVIVGLGSLGAGVQMFFVISGYCISATAESFIQRRAVVSQYFLRRFWRIYPPYWALFLLMGTAVTLSEHASSHGWIPGSLHSAKSPADLSASQLIGNVTLTETWRFHLFGNERKLFLLHAWTLCYEEQFYLIVGLILLLFPQHFFKSVFGVSLISLTLLIATGFDLIDVTGFGVDLLWHPFSLGVLVYYRIQYATPKNGMLIDCGLFSIAVLALIANFLPWNWTELSYRIIRGTAVSTVFAGLLVALYKWDELLVTKWPLKVLASVGRFSYSLYLVHATIVPVLARILQKAGIDSDLEVIFVTLPICIAVSLPISWVFYACCERPFLYKKPQEVKSELDTTTRSVRESGSGSEPKNTLVETRK